MRNVLVPEILKVRLRICDNEQIEALKVTKKNVKKLRK